MYMEKLLLDTENSNLPTTAVRKYQNAQPCYCGHCNNKIALDVFLKFYHADSPPRPGYAAKNPVTDYYVGQCPFCGKPVILNAHDGSTLPPVKSFAEVEGLPNDIEALYNEMRNAYAVQSYTCCVIAGRTLMANISVEQGAEDGKGFVYYVNYLVDNFLPKSNSKPWVDKVRLLGNDSAHHLVIADQEMAKTSLKFLEAILKNVYEFPNGI